MGMYSRLEAINHMLLMSGEHLVNHLEDDSGVDTSVAEHILNESVKNHIMRGVINNTYCKKFVPDVNGYIYLPADTAHVELAEAIYSSTEEQYILASYKGSTPYLFNVTENTHSWTDKGDSDGIKLKLVVNMDWEDIESPMQKGIMSSAARDYQMISQGDANVDQYLAQREVVYGAKGKAADIKQKSRNFLGQDISSSLASTRSYHIRTARRWRS